MRINTRSKVTVAAGCLGIAALFGSATGVVAAAPGGMPNEAHVVALAPAGMPDPARLRAPAMSATLRTRIAR